MFTGIVKDWYLVLFSREVISINYLEFFKLRRVDWRRNRREFCLENILGIL